MNFHLSLPVKNLAESRDFYTRVLQAKVDNEVASGYINIVMGGAQLTLHERPEMQAPSKDIHFGMNLAVDAFVALAEHIQRTAADCIKVQPKLVDAGTAQERRKMFLQCPSGYLIELKGVAE